MNRLVSYIGSPADIEAITLADFVVYVFNEVEKQKMVLVSRIISNDTSDTVSIDSITDEDDYIKICIANEAEQCILNLYKDYIQFDGILNIEDKKELIGIFITFVINSMTGRFNDALAILLGIFSAKGFIMLPFRL